MHLLAAKRRNKYFGKYSSTLFTNKIALCSVFGISIKQNKREILGVERGWFSVLPEPK